MYIYSDRRATESKKSRLSGGISIYFREELKDTIVVVDKNDCGIIWIKLSNELFHFNEDVCLCYVDIPPTSSKVLKDKLIFFQEIEKGKIYIEVSCGQN